MTPSWLLALPFLAVAIGRGRGLRHRPKATGGGTPTNARRFSDASLRYFSDGTVRLFST